MRPYRDAPPEPDAERRYLEAVELGDFGLARRLFEHLPHPEQSVALPFVGPLVYVRWRAAVFERLPGRFPGREGMKGAWLYVSDEQPVAVGFSWRTVFNDRLRPETVMGLKIVGLFG